MKTTNMRRSIPVALALGLAASVLASVMPSVSPASAGALQATPRVAAASTDLDAALNDVVAAGVPGVIVRVMDTQHAARTYAAGVAELGTGTPLRPTAQYR